MRVAVIEAVENVTWAVFIQHGRKHCIQMFRGSQGNFNNELIHSPSQPLHEGLSHTRVADVHGTRTHESQSVHNDGVCTSDGQQYSLKVYKEKDIFLPCSTWI